MSSFNPFSAIRSSRPAGAHLALTEHAPQKKDPGPGPCNVLCNRFNAFDETPRLSFLLTTALLRTCDVNIAEANQGQHVCERLAPDIAGCLIAWGASLSTSALMCPSLAPTQVSKGAPPPR